MLRSLLWPCLFAVALAAGTCRFTQSCIPNGLDDPTCTPRPVEANETEPRPFSGGQDDVCAEYKDSACCSWQQRQLLGQNFMIIDETLGKSAGSSGCAACGANLKRLWCDYTCAPDQSFVDVHGLKEVLDPESGITTKALFTTALIDEKFSCDTYDSCVGVAYVQQFPPMKASCTGFLDYLGQTEAIGHGNAVSWKYSQDPTVPRVGGGAPAYPCCGYLLPGSNVTESCSCGVCDQSCAPDCGVVAVKPVSVPVLTGFDTMLVGGIYIGIAVLSSIALFYQRFRRQQEVKKAGGHAIP